MKKKAFLRGFLGFPLGMAIGQTISIIASLIYGNGFYSPCSLQLIDTMGKIGRASCRERV